ncbi:hypothetical protein K3495_g6438 [Podosphaera aphanis]|nr:hypothetical protein K3495_g6438 [Podosphaera aphanis]
MKFGQKFRRESAPQWASFNVDYDELKNIIRIHTTKSQNQAITIPGQKDTFLERFESQYYCELVNQHDRVDLFVKSKTGEINRRLHFLQKQIFKHLSRISSNTHPTKLISPQRLEKLARYDGQLERCGEDIRCLQRFISAQRMAFHKILKKYTKWTGSRALAEKFTDDVLTSPKSFTRWDSEPLVLLYTDLLTSLRAAVPNFKKERNSTARLNPEPPNAETATESEPLRTYWNEYDNGSEAEDEPYLVYIDPDLESFPGVRTLTYVFSKARMPVEKVKEWFNFTPSPGERQPLLGYRHDNIREHQSFTDTDVDEVYAPSLDSSTGHATYCAELQSAEDQELNSHRESLLFRTMLGSFTASFVLLLVAGMLAFTGKKKLRVEVDAGVIVGVIASLFFATVGFCLMRCRRETLSWPHRISVSLTYVIACIFNCLILVEVSENK